MSEEYFNHLREKMPNSGYHSRRGTGWILNKDIYHKMQPLLDPAHKALGGGTWPPRDNARWLGNDCSSDDNCPNLANAQRFRERTPESTLIYRMTPLCC